MRAGYPPQSKLLPFARSLTSLAPSDPCPCSKLDDDDGAYYDSRYLAACSTWSLAKVEMKKYEWS